MSFLLLVCSSFGLATTLPSPIVEYKFNETGNSAPSTGSEKIPLRLVSKTDRELHSGEANGVSGIPEDRCFDNSWWTDASVDHGFGEHEINSDTVDGLKSATWQGWLQYSALLNQGQRIFEKGSYIVLMRNNTLKLTVAGTEVTSSADYNILNEWVFFAVTFDADSTTNNVKFYVGTKGQQVKLVSSHTLNKEITPNTRSLKVGAWGQGTGPYKGLMDNLRIYGSKADNTGVLTLEQLEALRIQDYALVPDPTQSTVEVFPLSSPAGRPITITTSLSHASGTKICGLKVKLTKVGGDLAFEPQWAMSDGEGRAIFPITSATSGFLRLKVSIEVAPGTEPVVLSDAVDLYFANPIGLEKQPLVEYLFDEPGDFGKTGSYAFSSGLLDTPLQLVKRAGGTPANDAATDLHSQRGVGVSGMPNDKAFDNNWWTDATVEHGYGKQEQNKSELDGLKSATWQGWFKVDAFPEYSTRLFDKRAYLVVLRGEYLRLLLQGGSDLSSAKLGVRTGEWVFFAVTYDNTKIEDNLQFFVGTITEEVRLVSKHTYAIEMPTSTKALHIGLPSNAASPVFKGLLDNMRIFGSKNDNTGVLTQQELEKIRQGDMLVLPDASSSKVETNLASCPADGETTTNVTVKVVDIYGSPVAARKVILSKTSGNLDFEPRTANTNADGIATFPISSIKSGNLTLAAKVDVATGFQPIELQGKLPLTFTQVVSSSKSSFAKDTEPVSADGQSTHVVKLRLSDMDDKPIVGRKVSLTTPTTEFTIEGPNEKTTSSDPGELGEVTFAIKANASKTPLAGKIVATIDPNQGSSDVITMETELAFAGRLLVAADGGEHSKIAELKRVLAPGLPENKLAADEIPNDGVSKWQVKVQLLAANGPVERLVQISDPASQLVDTDFSAVEIRTDAHGMATFEISTDKTLPDTLTVNLLIAALGDVASWNEEIKIIPRDFALWVTKTTPEADNEEAEVGAPFVIEFNEEIKLVPGQTKISVIPDSGPQPAVTINDSYSLGNANWLADGKVLTWQHEQLDVNVWYTATIEGIEDNNDNTLEKFVWRFKGTDRTPPSIRIEAGRLAVDPLPWAVGVSTSKTLMLGFTEKLAVDGTGKPVGLNVELAPAAVVEYASYDPLTFEVTYTLSNLSEDTTYQVTVSEAEDWAHLIMEPVSWNFTTEPLDNTFRVVKADFNKNPRGDALTNTPIYVYFNKQLKATPSPKIVVTNVKTNAQVVGPTTFEDDLLQTGLAFKPTAPLAYDTIYTVSLQNVLDEDGNPPSTWLLNIITEVQTSGQQTLGWGENVFLVPQETGTATITLNVPTDSVPEETILEVLNVHQRDKQSLAEKLYNPQLALTPAIYELSAINGDSALGKLGEQMELTLPYLASGNGTVTDLNWNQLAANGLRLYKFDPAMGEWLPVKSTVNLEARTVTGFVDSFGIYGLAGGAQLPTTYLTDVKLSVNPLASGSGGVRGETVFKFGLSHDSKVTLTIYDRSGRVLTKLLDNEVFLAGYNGFAWDGVLSGRKLPAGIYLYRLFASSIDPDFEGNHWVSGVIGIIQ